MTKQSVEVVIPVYNEEALLEKNTIILHDFLEKNCSIPWNITIFSNGSTDNTVEIGNKLHKEYPRISIKHMPEKGRAKALRLAWEASDASIVSYMDADLSTELEAFPKCLKLIEDGADIASGNRLSSESFVERRLIREVLSRGYNSLIRVFFPFTKIKDAQCGFKLIRTPVAKKLLPQIKDNMWFFDSELLLLAERAGYKIDRVQVRWIERKASKVKVFKTTSDYILKLAELRTRIWMNSLRGKSQK
jgi:glycosyltransferase involved in cell wall biosynthesis